MKNIGLYPGIGFNVLQFKNALDAIYHDCLKKYFSFINKNVV